VTTIVISLIKKLFNTFEYIICGSALRESISIFILKNYYNSKLRREWKWSKTPPHFEDHRIFFFNFAFTKKNYGPYFLFRGFYTAELIRENDKVLDIGCGDGFLSKRFYSKRARIVDALDIDTDAINCARRYNFSENIKYYNINAISDSFPEQNYNIIAWDGAIGHFSLDSINKILKKIRHSLNNDGVFCGSESLGLEGDDHLFIIKISNELYLLFEPFFRYVQFKQIHYELDWANGIIRKEIFWRCSNNINRLSDIEWEKFYQDNSQGADNEH
jgi:SAM-dependent methyltransferase